MKAAKNLKKLGRPAISEGVRREHRSVSMDPGLASYAEEIGEGSLSRGVDKALRALMDRDAAQTVEMLSALFPNGNPKG